jgi:prepilin-type processing-associated H-X9-DG protein
MSPDTVLVYPEYMTDPWVLICPSDSWNFEADDNPFARIEDDGSGTCQWVGLISMPMQSYTYTGYALTKADKDDPTTTFPTTTTVSPAQFVAGFWTLTQPGGPVDALGSPPSDDTNDGALDEDITIIAPYSGQDLGTGAGDVIYRLREGIERFVISDINNAAASAMAQSELVVMWDTVTTKSYYTLYNHIPGGSNVLFMDGHVRFMKYPNNSFPCTEEWANTQRELDLIINPGH